MQQVICLFFLLNIQWHSNIREVNQQIIIDVGLDNGIKRIIKTIDIALKAVY